jgi:tryptophan 2-monooxygenase
MELTLGVTNYAQALVSPQVAQAIMRTHVVSSSKVAALIPNFWSGNSGAVRCLQTDNIAHQVYTLDYTPYGGGPPDPHGVCFISYVWDDDAVKQQSITDGAPTGPAYNQKLYTYLLGSIATIGDPVKTWAQQNLVPVNSDYQNNVIFEEWQSSPYFGGAFKLSEPGQDQYTQMMFFDYQKAGTTNDTGVYLAGDCLSWTSGWVEGGLTTGLNAAAGVIVSLRGTLNTDANSKTPMTINANRYTYWG